MAKHMSNHKSTRRPKHPAKEVYLPIYDAQPKTRNPSPKKERSRRPRKAKPAGAKIRPKFAKRPYKPRPLPAIPKPIFWPIHELPGNPPRASADIGTSGSTFQIWGNRDYLALVTDDPCPMHPEQIDEIGRAHV